LLTRLMLHLSLHGLGRWNGHSCVVAHKEILMKAVLEFNYPEDEDKLRHALKGTDYYNALLEIENLLNNSPNKASKFVEVREVINQTLEGVRC